MRRWIVIAVLGVLAGGCGEDDPAPAPAADRFDAQRAFRDLEAQVAIGPRHAGSPGSRELVALLESRLRDVGAQDVRVQSPHRNVVATIPGRTEDVIVVGAHHDTKDDVPAPFEGANDGASGVAVVLELARALTADAPLAGPSIRLALFDAEEARGDRDFAADGLRGSRQYVDYAAAGGRQGSPPLGEISAMVLFDLVGDCDLEIPREANSDPELYGAFEGEPFGGETSGVLDDHVPFIEVGIPALDVIDFAYGPGPPPGAYWHTPEDTLDKVCPESLDAVGEAALIGLRRLP